MSHKKYFALYNEASDGKDIAKYAFPVTEDKKQK